MSESELSRFHSQEVQREPEYIEIEPQERALREAQELARSLSSTLRNAVVDTKRQRALRDLVAIVDNQLSEELTLLKDPDYKRQLRPMDRQQFQRAFEYLQQTTETIDVTAE